MPKKSQQPEAARPARYPRHRTRPLYMGCGGSGKPGLVIDHGRVMS